MLSRFSLVVQAAVLDSQFFLILFLFSMMTVLRPKCPTSAPMEQISGIA
jgi:hypothetical protein